MLPVRVDAVPQQQADLGVGTEAVLGGQPPQEAKDAYVVHHRDERLGKHIDQQLDDLGVVLEVERRPQRRLAVDVPGAQ